ncbi:uncharacterized protein LOC34622093 [Cyclospora cayetanensis]|uniref:Uncharacterized protein LOC34622093 n=2 Tax=Cyclospora cayetanensis TaxID=88456 RepID=A0A6P5WEY6_9EIME|nr:uncharacterized protein LOC34622093 [Cyclospora cayetanensis]OEH75233.1 hypothetical protein cyc_05794 [Cyclospora cayetanensis]
MTVSKLVRCRVVVALLTASVPLISWDSNCPVGLMNSTCTFGLCVANAQEFPGDEDYVEDESREKGDDGISGAGPTGDAEIEAPDKSQEGGESAEQGTEKDASQASNSLRGSAARKKNIIDSQSQARTQLNKILSSFLESFGQDVDHPLAEHAEESQKLHELVDKIFVPRLQTAPKYHGALECINEAIYRSLLSGPKKAPADSKLLRRAYDATRMPPVALQVPSMFVELREAADKHVWDKERALARRQHEHKGDPVPRRFLLTAEDLVAEYAEQPRVKEDDLSEDELGNRLKIINEWIKQQFRLRLYHRKRIGTLKGNPQDYLVTFNAGSNYAAVEIDDIEGLSFDAELDPEPSLDLEELSVQPNASAEEL